VVRMSLVELSVSVSVCGFADEVIVLCMEQLCVRIMQLASFTIALQKVSCICIWMEPLCVRMMQLASFTFSYT
jgi:hypothetical protein